MVKNIIPKLGWFSLVTSFRRCKTDWITDFYTFSFPVTDLFIHICISHVKISLSCQSFMSGRAGHQPAPAADGAVSLGDGLGGNVVSLQSCVPF